MGYPKDDESRPHVCSICAKAFKRNEHLTRHMNTHTGTKPFECTFPQCNKKFSRNDELKRHYNIHTTTVPRKKRGRKKKVVEGQEPHAALETPPIVQQSSSPELALLALSSNSSSNSSNSSSSASLSFSAACLGHSGEEPQSFALVPGGENSVNNNNNNNNNSYTASTGNEGAQCQFAPQRKPVSFQLGNDRDEQPYYNTQGPGVISNGYVHPGMRQSHGTNYTANNNSNSSSLPSLKKSRSHGSMGGSGMKLNLLSTLKLMTPINAPEPQSTNYTPQLSKSNSNSNSHSSLSVAGMNRVGSSGSLAGVSGTGPGIFMYSSEMNPGSRVSSSSSLHNLHPTPGSFTNLSSQMAGEMGSKFLDNGNYKIHKSANSATSLVSLNTSTSTSSLAAAATVNGFATHKKSLPGTPARRNSNVSLNNDSGLGNSLANKLQELINSKPATPVPTTPVLFQQQSVLNGNGGNANEKTTMIPESVLPPIRTLNLEFPTDTSGAN